MIIAFAAVYAKQDVYTRYTIVLLRSSNLSTVLQRPPFPSKANYSAGVK